MNTAVTVVPISSAANAAASQSASTARAVSAGLGSLPALMFLNLEKNQLGGPVPPELGNATALVGVLLSSNQLEGT